MSIAILTPMEEMICKLKAHGFQRKEIASRLNRSENTLIVHNKHIHSKLHANNDVEVVLRFVAIKYGIDIMKIVQISILLAVLLPSILLDELAIVRTYRPLQNRTIRATRARKNECETDFNLE